MYAGNRRRTKGIMDPKSENRSLCSECHRRLPSRNGQCKKQHIQPVCLIVREILLDVRSKSARGTVKFFEELPGNLHQGHRYRTGIPHDFNSVLGYDSAVVFGCPVEHRQPLSAVWDESYQKLTGKCKTPFSAAVPSVYHCPSRSLTFRP